MVWFETRQADINLSVLSAPEVDALEDSVYAYYNAARDEFRLDAARADILTISNFIGSLSAREVIEE